jgi:hypothetical protein
MKYRRAVNSSKHTPSTPTLTYNRPAFLKGDTMSFQGPFFRFAIPVVIMAAALLVLAACEEAATFPAARNSISGQLDGTAFTARNVLCVKDTNDVLTISGRIRDDVRFNISFVDEFATEHPVQTEGGFLEFIDVLDSLYNIDPPIEDSLILDSLANGLLELLASDEEPLAPDRSFAFYILGDFIYYSESGSLTIDELDTGTGRFSGTMDIRLVNFFGGRKQWNAELDDIRILE